MQAKRKPLIPTLSRVVRETEWASVPAGPGQAEALTPTLSRRVREMVGRASVPAMGVAYEVVVQHVQN